LITSRKYYNFAKDTLREGSTVKPFDHRQSWDLLIRLLGPDWKRLDDEGKLPQTEIIAAKAMLERLEGLALAIKQAAILIKNPEIGGPTICEDLRYVQRQKQNASRTSFGASFHFRKITRRTLGYDL
jgi:hypothetical protein